MRTLNEIHDDLCDITLEERKYIILQLMKEKKLTYEDITSCYTAWLQYMKEHISDEYQQLKNMVIGIWVEDTDKNGKNRLDRVKDAMHLLLDKGQLNATHKQIDAKQ